MFSVLYHFVVKNKKIMTPLFSSSLDLAKSIFISLQILNLIFVQTMISEIIELSLLLFVPLFVMIFYRTQIIAKDFQEETKKERHLRLIDKIAVFMFFFSPFLLIIVAIMISRYKYYGCIIC